MIQAQSNSFALVWMFCSKQSHNLINKLQERALRILNYDQKSNFQDLISKYEEYANH